MEKTNVWRVIITKPLKVIHEDNFKYVGDTSVSSIIKKIFLLFGVQH